MRTTKKQWTDVLSVGRRTKMENERNLEWYVANTREPCEACHKPILIHGYRAKGKFRRAIYGSCQDKTCRKYLREICLLGS